MFSSTSKETEAEEGKITSHSHILVSTWEAWDVNTGSQTSETHHLHLTATPPNRPLGNAHKKAQVFNLNFILQNHFFLKTNKNIVMCMFSCLWHQIITWSVN